MRLGKIPENAYKRSVAKYLQTGNGQRITSLRQTAPDYEMAPAVFLQDAVNEVAASFARAQEATVGVIVPPDAQEKVIASVMAQCARVCEEEDVKLTNAGAKTLQLLSAPVISITVTGEAEEPVNTVSKNVDLLLVNSIAMAGTGILATEREEELSRKFSHAFIGRAKSHMTQLSVTKAAKIARENGAKAAYALSEGGVFAGLWDFASKWNAGLDVDLKKIPIRQESVEISEVFQINPYQLLSTGALLVAAENGLEMQRAFR
ncbi:MAG: hypothetical protein IJU25_06450, partial [Lachnospiraceae bacterium]|nr:hypothetical protein [Lachnospiraceae bacterium]